MVRWIAIISLLMTGACKNERLTHQDPYGRKADENLAPVSDAGAPTVKELMSEGYLIVGKREVGSSCGWKCTRDGFDALYLGIRNNPSDDANPAQYACPGTEADYAAWKCRALSHPYVPNHGFRPES